MRQELVGIVDEVSVLEYSLSAKCVWRRKWVVLQELLGVRFKVSEGVVAEMNMSIAANAIASSTFGRRDMIAVTLVPSPDIVSSALKLTKS